MISRNDIFGGKFKTPSKDAIFKEPSSVNGKTGFEEEISENFPEISAKNEKDDKNPENSEEKSSSIFAIVPENFVTGAEKKNLQNQVLAEADEMGISNEEKERLLLSYYAAGMLKEKLRQKKSQKNPYGFAENQKEEIQKFINEQVAKIYNDQVSDSEKKGSQKKRKNAILSRRSQKKKGGFGKALAWISGGVVASGSMLV